jgi:hypothetical protein
MSAGMTTDKNDRRDGHVRGQAMVVTDMTADR